jgi:hypothetical protein
VDEACQRREAGLPAGESVGESDVIRMLGEDYLIKDLSASDQ